MQIQKHIQAELDAANEEFEARVAAIEARVAAIQEQCRKEDAPKIIKLFASHLKDHPEIEAIGMPAYTPYWMDGEECEYELHSYFFVKFFNKFHFAQFLILPSIRGAILRIFSDMTSYSNIFLTNL